MLSNGKQWNILVIKKTETYFKFHNYTDVSQLYKMCIVNIQITGPGSEDHIPI